MAADRQIFYDPSGRRRKRFTLARHPVRAAQRPDRRGVVRDDPRGPGAAAAAGRAGAWRGAARRRPRPCSRGPAGRSTWRSARLLGTQPPSARKVGARKATAVATAMSKPLYVGFYGPWDESLERLASAAHRRPRLAGAGVGDGHRPNHQFSVLPDPQRPSGDQCRAAPAADPAGRPEFL